jgi:murein DD-endopeptidase MepM/ murein hydrolase activator NlpD
MIRGGSAGLLAAVLAVSGCVNTNALDWDLRTNGGTAGAAQAVSARPMPDQNGVISYPGYQVAVARQGDTVASVAARVGVAPDQLARFNALGASDRLRQGEILALPVRVAASPAAFGAPATGGVAGGIDVEAIASSAIDRTGAPVTSAQSAQQLPFSTTGSGPVPVRYQVKRGETAFTIARQFNISAKALADWNGLPSDLSVREGQYLIIPTAADLARGGAETMPGQGSPTPMPPSASEPLPNETTVTAAQAAQTGQAAPDLGSSRTNASAAAMAMPVQGKIIKPYDGKGNQGIDIAAAAGTSVKAAAAGTVAVVTKDAGSGSTIVILKHEGGLLTVYAGLDGASVAKGASVKRGASLGTLRAGTLHFEVRQGQQAVDPLSYLQ